MFVVQTFGSSALGRGWSWMEEADVRWRSGSSASESAFERELEAVRDVLAWARGAGVPQVRIRTFSRVLAEAIDVALHAEDPSDLESALPPRERRERVMASVREVAAAPARVEWSGLVTGVPSAPIVDSPTAPGLTSPSLREQLIACESRVLGPAARSDAGALEEILHPEFDEIGRHGTHWERSAVIETLQTLPNQTRQVSFDRVVELAPGVAHIRFRTEDSRGVVHRSSIWVHENGRWQQRYHQGTPETEQPVPVE